MNAPKPKRLRLSPSLRFERFEVGLTFVLMLISALCAWAMMRYGMVHSNDFKHLWLGPWLLEHGVSPYDAAKLRLAAAERGWAINPFVYLPTTGLLLAPLTRLRFEAALVLWYWLNWLLAWGTLWLAPSWLGLPRPGRARLAAAVFLVAALPFLRQLSAGQMNVVTAALLVWAAGALRRERHWQLGLALALGFAWKIAPLALILALLPMRRWRALGWATLFSALLLGAALWRYGVPVHREAFEVVSQMGYGQSTWADVNDFYRDPFNQSFNALYHHLLTLNPYTTPWFEGTPVLANRATLLTMLMLAGLWFVVTLLVYWQKPGRTPGRARPRLEAPTPGVTIFMAATLLMLLSPSLMWDHYCVQALPALMWIFGHDAFLRRRSEGVLALFALGAITVPIVHPYYNHGPAILLMSLRLWGVLALFALLLVHARDGHANATATQLGISSD